MKPDELYEKVMATIQAGYNVDKYDPPNLEGRSIGGHNMSKYDILKEKALAIKDYSELTREMRAEIRPVADDKEVRQHLLALYPEIEINDEEATEEIRKQIRPSKFGRSFNTKQWHKNT